MTPSRHTAVHSRTDIADPYSVDTRHRRVPPARWPVSGRSWPLCLALALVSAGCAPVGRVLLLPQPGASGAVVVTTPTAQLVLNEPYAAAELARDGSLSVARSSEAEVRERYPALLALQPPPPQVFTLQFMPGSSELTAESSALLDPLIAAARARPGGEIVVIGHTDRQGEQAANDALSLQRANAIRDLLMARGFQASLIEAVGRGEREPLVPTDDEVVEPRNRRAEVVVR